MARGTARSSVTGATSVHVGPCQFTMLAVKAIAQMIGGHGIRGRPTSDQSSHARIAPKCGDCRFAAGVHVTPRARFAGMTDGATG